MRSLERETFRFGLAAVFIFALSMAVQIASPGCAAALATACTDTRTAALAACQSDADAERSLAIGMCDNISNPAERTSCTTAADSARTEALDLCDEQDAARGDICVTLGESPYDPPIDPRDFVDPAAIGRGVPANRFFPLTRGLQWTYRGADEVIVVTVRNKTKRILGVKCAVIHDVVTEDGVVTEDTEDWYAQDVHGNVWYFGEISQQFEHGELVGTEGSWKAGRDHAKPGILMLASPRIDATYRQEFLLGDAEDMATVTSLTGSARSPATSCSGNCVITHDFSALEPDRSEDKYYKPGVGLIQEIDPATGEPVTWLVELEQP